MSMRALVVAGAMVMAVAGPAQALTCVPGAAVGTYTVNLFGVNSLVHPIADFAVLTFDAFGNVDGTALINELGVGVGRNLVIGSYALSADCWVSIALASSLGTEFYIGYLHTRLGQIQFASSFDRFRQMSGIMTRVQ